MSTVRISFVHIERVEELVLPGSVKKGLDYHVIDGFVQHFSDPPSGSWTKSNFPAGISISPR
jgi:hypothetical protein